MKKKGLFGLTVAAAVLFGGCALMQPKKMLDDPTLYDEYMTRSFDYSPAACYDATKKTFADNDVSLAKDSPETGKMVTEKYAVASFSQRDKSNRNMDNKQYIKFWITVTGDDSSCEIKVTKLKAWMNTQELSYVYPEIGGPSLWDPIFNSIKDQLEDDND
ncbi:MAG: hypothetical protein IJ896_12540 [Fibrobacter sp.]|nr:hypothetical protein [Fibrobacter sp.]